MGCGSSTSAAGEAIAPPAATAIAAGQKPVEAKYVPGPAAPAQQQQHKQQQQQAAAVVKSTDSAASAASTAPPRGAGHHRGESFCPHTARVVPVPLPAPHAAFVCYRGAGTSWGVIKARGSTHLSGARPWFEFEVAATQGGDSVRVGLMQRGEKLQLKPGFGIEPSSVGWSPATGMVMHADNLAVQCARHPLHVGDRVSVKLVPAAAAGAGVSGEHNVEFYLNGVLMVSTAVAAPPVNADLFVPVIAVQDGAAVLWDGESHADGAALRAAHEGLGAAGDLWATESARLQAEQERVAIQMALEKENAVRLRESKAREFEAAAVQAARAAMAQRAEEEKRKREMRLSQRMGELDYRRKSLGLPVPDDDAETAAAQAEHAALEAAAARAHAEEAEKLDRELAEKAAARRTISAVVAEEADRAQLRILKLHDRALRILTSPLRRCAQHWRAYTEERREMRQNGVDPASAKRLRRQQTLGSPSFGARRRTLGSPAFPARKPTLGSPAFPARKPTLGSLGFGPRAPNGLTPLTLSAPANPLLPSATLSPSAVSSFRTLPKVKPLSDKVILEQYDGTGRDGLRGYEWILRNEHTERLLVTMNFERCKGMELHGPPVQKSIVRAFESKLIAVATQASRTQGFAMSYSVQCTALPPDPAETQAASAADNAIVEAVREKMKQTHIPPIPVRAGVVGSGGSAPSAASWSSVHTQLSRVPGLSFYDEAFPPTRTSVYSMGEGADTPLDTSLPVAWRRLFAFLPDGAQPSFYDPVADPNDIAQGRLGNCWLCSALSAAGETPELVAALFTDDDPDAEGAEEGLSASRRGGVGGRLVQRINEQGLYSVRLCISGRWQTILLDDFFPCFPSAGPLFTQNRGSQIWVLLAEKAFGKVAGGYDRLVSGQAQHALADLTGCPVRSVPLTQPQSAPLLANGATGLWQLMLSDAAQDLSMCASTVGKEHATDALNALLRSVGLVAGHSYTCLHCLEVPRSCATSGGTRLIELRNPWGNGEWTGDWSDRSPLWTDELKRVLKPNISAEGDTEDGIFYMCLEDFLKYFHSVTTCFIRSPQFRPWQERRAAGTWGLLPDAELSTACSGAKAAHMYEFSVSEASDVWSVIYQPDAHLPGASELVDQGVMVLRVDGTGAGAASLSDPRVVIDTGIERSRQSNATARLEPGRYVMLPYSTGNKQRSLQQLSRPFTVALLADVASTCASLCAVPFSLALQQAALLSLLRGPRGECETLGKTGALSLLQVRLGASHVFACALSAAAPHPMRITLDAAPASNARSHQGHSGTAHSRTLKPGQAQVFHHMTPIDDRKPASYNVDLNYKTQKD